MREEFVRAVAIACAEQCVHMYLYNVLCILLFLVLYHSGYT